MVVRRDDYVGPGIVVKLSDTPASIRRAPPALGDLKAAANEPLFH